MTTFNNEEEQYITSTPPDILTEARTACDSLLPSISKDRYITTYENFLKWKNMKNVKSFSENVVLAYFFLFPRKCVKKRRTIYVRIGYNMLGSITPSPSARAEIPPRIL